MKKSDRLKPKKKRKYRMDHEEIMRKYYDKLNKPMYEFGERLRQRLSEVNAK